MYKPRARAGTNVFGSFGEEPRRGLSYERVALMMLRALEYNADIQDPAIQGAIDEFASPWRDGRAGLFEFLRSEAKSSLGNGDRWAHSIGGMLAGDWVYVKDVYIKRATGKTRQQWLDLLAGKPSRR